MTDEQPTIRVWWISTLPHVAPIIWGIQLSLGISLVKRTLPELSPKGDLFDNSMALL
ncbi:MAG: hypothetical protein P8O91_09180 [Luminiphilus sp.]|nr:hypothetical protein [Luminiphilus sp.]